MFFTITYDIVYENGKASNVRTFTVEAESKTEATTIFYEDSPVLEEGNRYRILSVKCQNQQGE